MNRAIITAAGAIVCMCMAMPASADEFGAGANQFTIDFVTISGDASSANGTFAGSSKTFENPDYAYRIGVYEITNDQWNKFKAELGVPVTGDPGVAYDQDASWPAPNVPTNEVSWYEAAQMVNWLNTSTGHAAAYTFTGTQGQSDYTLDIWSPAEAAGGTNLYRHKDAFYFLPNDDEWVKAAHWNGTALQLYATPDNSVPVAGVDSNYDLVVGEPWDVGSGSEELNGTFDMMGNVFEWMEGPYYAGGYAPDGIRPHRGGSYLLDNEALTLWNRYADPPFYEALTVGFRVAAGTAPGDFDVDGDVDADDIDLLCENMGDPAFDLDGDGDADEDDQIFLIENLVELSDGSGRTGALRADFDLDGFIGATDLAIFQSSSGSSGISYAGGNANCDDIVDGTDLAILAANFGFIAPPAPVPEPASAALLAMGALSLLLRRR